MNRVPGVPFCDADAMDARQVCVDLVAAEPMPCGPLEHCVDDGPTVKCGCVTGAVLVGTRCQMASGCDQANGGCDPLTICQPSATGLTCTACPPGYSGTGMTGCLPLPTALSVMGADLVPAFDANTHEYSVKVPYFRESVTFTMMGPQGAALEIEGADARLGMPWQSQKLKLGENNFSIVLRSEAGPNAYKVHVTRTTLMERMVLKASNANSTDTFGYAVAMSATTLAISAVMEDTGAGNSGAVYIFAKNGDAWEQRQILKASTPGAEDCFGSSLALAGDTLVVGAFRESPCSGSTVPRPGGAYVFNRQGDMWTQTTQLMNPDADNGDGFGSGVVAAKDSIVVGSGYSDKNGRDSGAAYVFGRGPEGWKYLQTLTAAQPSAGARFGWGLVLEDRTLVVSALEETTEVAASAGAAYVFSFDGQAWNFQQRLVPSVSEKDGNFGHNMTLLGNRLVIGAPAINLLADTQRGQVFVFDRSAGSMFMETQLLNAPIPRSSDWYGMSVALNGSLLAIGAGGDASGARGLDGDLRRTDSPGSGAVHIYSVDSTLHWQAAAYLKAAESDANDAFGCSTAMSDTTLVTSANFEAGSAKSAGMDNNVPFSGAAYIYQ
jgi:hypothetical protein